MTERGAFVGEHAGAIRAAMGQDVAHPQHAALVVRPQRVSVRRFPRFHT